MNRLSVYLVSGIIALITVFTGVSPAWANAQRANEESPALYSGEESRKQTTSVSSNVSTAQYVNVSFDQSLAYEKYSDEIFNSYLAFKSDSFPVKNSIDLIHAVYPEESQLLPRTPLAIGVVSQKITWDELKPGDILWAKDNAALYIGSGLAAIVEDDEVIEIDAQDLVQEGYKPARF